MSQKPLRPVASLVGGDSVIVKPGQTGPYFSGWGEIEFSCPKCGDALAESMYEDQIFDLIVHCGACGQYAAFPELVGTERPPLRPGVAKHLYVPAGKYRFDGTADIGSVTLITEKSVRRQEDLRAMLETLKLPTLPS